MSVHDKGSDKCISLKKCTRWRQSRPTESSCHTGVRSHLTDFNSVAQIFQEDPSVWGLGASTLFCKGDLWVLRNIRNNICLFVGKAVETCCVAMKQLQHLKSSIRSHIAVAAWERKVCGDGDFWEKSGRQGQWRFNSWTPNTAKA